MRKLELNNVIDIVEKLEEIVKENEISFLEACLVYCDENDIEVETLGDIIKRNQNMKSKIQVEAEELNFIKKKYINKSKLVFE